MSNTDKQKCANCNEIVEVFIPRFPWPTCSKKCRKEYENKLNKDYEKWKKEQTNGTKNT